MRPRFESRHFLVASARHVFQKAIIAQVLSLINLLAFGSTFVMQWWIGVAIQRFPTDALGHYPIQAYRAVLLVTAVATLASFLWYLPLARAQTGKRP